MDGKGGCYEVGLVSLGFKTLTLSPYSNKRSKGPLRLHVRPILGHLTGSTED